MSGSPQTGTTCTSTPLCRAPSCCAPRRGGWRGRRWRACRARFCCTASSAAGSGLISNQLALVRAEFASIRRARPRGGGGDPPPRSADGVSDRPPSQQARAVADAVHARDAPPHPPEMARDGPRKQAKEEAFPPSEAAVRVGEATTQAASRVWAAFSARYANP